MGKWVIEWFGIGCKGLIILGLSLGLGLVRGLDSEAEQSEAEEARPM